ncbi:MAG: heterodisulfide reductase subunit A [Armatimonadetes bacterium CG_4_10_14_3_um_filter_66_18]|nr:FAD-dependent oxidoreductase [Armatimonadota bacterium]NCO90515.1 FAD-dependent oxidoreductase [Armatimonadota bacterium]NDK15502.1 FAD-dependent oxidoreductase [Armatimonadota bacterium]PIY39885.1 MAG: heterodisulfide reductase subunit A [Armatimonadetes bacterium CG_4_10_14_3_um_filter_66_18]PJB63113.1 MAG: heterodisulfide reductase subunit A [Armatimonadetes bacterium CG_4_9_14_3_um_filter_66_14]
MDGRAVAARPGRRPVQRDGGALQRADPPRPVPSGRASGSKADGDVSYGGLRLGQVPPVRVREQFPSAFRGRGEAVRDDAKRRRGAASLRVRLAEVLPARTEDHEAQAGGGERAEPPEHVTSVVAGAEPVEPSGAPLPCRTQTTRWRARLQRIARFTVADTEDNAQGSANGRLLIIGGGISGMTVALEAAETGREVVLVERSAYLGGRVVQSNQYFPKLCPPSCGLEINLKRLRANPRIRVYTLAEVEKVAGGKGNFEITVRQNPRFVNEKCTACDDCTAVCPVERDNPFNYGLDKTKAIYQPHQRSFPLRHVIDMTVCQGKDCNKCVAACKYDAIELDMQPRTFTVQAASVVIATGWQPPDATKLEKLGFGQYPNVITNVMMERLAAPDGPTGGKLLRPSDGHPAKKVAFVQCAGSRDENHYPYCSGVCCLASLKQATYVRESGADAEARIFYIDVRATGRLEDFFTRVSSDEKVSLNKGKVANIEEDPTTHNLFVEAEDTLSGRKLREEADLVVLATGMTPCDGLPELPLNVPRDDYGFFVDDDSRNGIYAVGCAKKPVDVATCVRDATGVALKAMQA